MVVFPVSFSPRSTSRSLCFDERPKRLHTYEFEHEHEWTHKHKNTYTYTHMQCKCTCISVHIHIRIRIQSHIRRLPLNGKRSNIMQPVHDFQVRPHPASQTLTTHTYSSGDPSGECCAVALPPTAPCHASCPSCHALAARPFFEIHSHPRK